MATGRPIPDHIRDAAIADYKASGQSLLIVSRRHGVSKAALSSWIKPGHTKRVRKSPWSDAELAYIGGWQVVGGVSRPLLPERRSA